MKQKIASLTATFKTAASFGEKYAADFPPDSLGGQEFAFVSAAVPQTSTLGAAQVSGGESAHAGVLSKVAGRFHLHDDLHHIADAAHSLVLMGTPGLQGKFLMPRSGGDAALLNTARAFQTDAPAFSTQFISLGLPAAFITQLGADIADFETAIKARGAGVGAQAGATGGLEDTANKARDCPARPQNHCSQHLQKRPGQTRRMGHRQPRRKTHARAARKTGSGSGEVEMGKLPSPLE
ncbi:MAG: hypothetical protein KGR98_14625 [Verrucomicrobia bacterium]|nr:hypothetical protein [Verrucomicrobiota bacterium]